MVDGQHNEVGLKYFGSWKLDYVLMGAGNESDFRL